MTSHPLDDMAAADAELAAIADRLDELDQEVAELGERYERVAKIDESPLLDDEDGDYSPDAAEVLVPNWPRAQAAWGALAARAEAADALAQPGIHAVRRAGYTGFGIDW